MLPKFKSKVFLAPMAGISDPAFRLLCVKQGAGLVFTELTSVNAVAKMHSLGKKELLEFLPFSEKERPVGVQLFGHDIVATKNAALILEPYFDMIDFNMGCPAQHVTAQMAGAALLDKPEHITKLLSGIISSTNKPVSVKMRAGVSNKNNKLFLKISKIAEDVGVEMITLHPRTVQQGYSGRSDWSLIKLLKEHVNIPVVGNGDIRTPEDAKIMFEETNCDYVMIGRGAMGNPFIFKQVKDYLKKGEYVVVPAEKKKDYFVEYLKLTKRYEVPFQNLKNQAMYFTRGMVGGAQLRVKIAKVKDIDELKDLF